MSDLPPLESTQPSDAPPPRGLPPEQLAALAAAPVEPLLAPLLLPGTLTLIQGPRGVGMSQVMAGCAVAMAAGGGFLGWQAPRPHSVLLLAGGETAAALARRVGVAQRAAGVAVGDRLGLVALGPQAPRMPNLALRDGQLDFETLCRHQPVVMIDDMASLLPIAGLECAEGGEMRHIVGRLRRDGTALVVSLANGRQARRRADITARAMLNGLADAVVDLSFPDDYAITDGCRFELRIARARHVIGPDRAPLEARLTTLADGTPSWSARPVRSDLRQRFEAMLATGATVAEAARRIGVSRASGYRLLREIENVARGDEDKVESFAGI